LAGRASLNRHVRAIVLLGRTLLGGMAVVASGIFAYTEMFSQFQYYDDEGYLLVSVKSFLDGHPLFDETFTPYGPFHFLVARFLYGVSGLPVSHDVTRIVTIGLWLATAAIAAVLIYRLTSSFGWALVAYLQTMLLCRKLVNEPGHPQAILLALTVTLPLIAAVLPNRRSGTVVSGVVAACIALTKINVGVFTTAALLIAYLAVTVPTPLATTGLLLVGLAATFLPFWLMRGADWAANYARIAALSIAACCLVIRRADIRNRRGTLHLGIFTVSAAAAGILILLTTLLTGTSLEGLVTGVFLAPIRFPSVYSIPWRLPQSGVVLGIVSVAAALLVSLLSPSRRAPLAVLLKLAFAVLVARTIWQNAPPDQLIVLAPLVWVTLLPPRPQSWQLEELFPRMVLCLLAASHLLVAYPVAGSQQDWATLLLVPAGIISAADALSVLVAPIHVSVRRAAALACIALVLVIYYPRFAPRSSLGRYRALVPLRLPGSDRMRLRDEQVQLYRDISLAIEQNCDIFVSMPGFNSFYLWTKQEPPTAQNATTWMTLFDDRMQQQIVERLDAHKSPCVIYNQLVTDEWVGDRDIGRGPLVRYIRTSFQTFRTIGDFELMARKGTPGVTAR
jgi:hypothetical protein